jgi:hypothetical protein
MAVRVAYLVLQLGNRLDDRSFACRHEERFFSFPKIKVQTSSGAATDSYPIGKGDLSWG